MEIYIHRMVTINKQFQYFSTVYFKRYSNEEWALSLSITVEIG